MLIKQDWQAVGLEEEQKANLLEPSEGKRREADYLLQAEKTA